MNEIASTQNRFKVLPTSISRDVSDDDADFLMRACNAYTDLADLARNVAGFDDSILRSADLSVLRATLVEYREQARAAIAKAASR